MRGGNERPVRGLPLLHSLSVCCSCAAGDLAGAGQYPGTEDASTSPRRSGTDPPPPRALHLSAGRNSPTVKDGWLNRDPPVFDERCISSRGYFRLQSVLGTSKVYYRLSTGGVLKIGHLQASISGSYLIRGPLIRLHNGLPVFLRATTTLFL